MSLGSFRIKGYKMKKIKEAFIIYISFFYIILFIISCDTEIPNKNNNEISVIIPLNMNNEWRYKQTQYDTNGVAIDSLYFTEVIYRDTLLRNEIWYGISNGRYATNRSDGFWIIFSEEIELLNLDLDTLLSHAILEWAYPSEKGNVYNFINNISFISVISTDTVITVPAGSFECYEYEKSSGVPDRFYFAPNIGLVRTDYFHFTIDGGKVYLAAKNELVSYRLKN
jgi:hypothetical protein